MTDSSLQELKELRRQAGQARGPFEADMFLNLSFFEGKQWANWNRGRIDDPTTRRQGPNKIFYVDNRIMPVVNTEIAKLTKQRPVWVATPRTGDEQDLSAARISEEILEYLWGERDLQKKLRKALEWSRVCGAGFWKIGWDKSLGGGTEVVVGPDGQPLTQQDGSPMKADEPTLQALSGLEGVESKKINQGDVFVEVRSPFEVYPDPLAETLEDCEWLIEETVQSKEYVQRRYDTELEPDTDAEAGLVESRGFSTNTGSTYKGIKVTEFWAKPSSKHPQGKRCVWAKEQILQEEEPLDPMPYVMFTGIDVPGRFWPSSVTQQLRGVNLELNKTKSQIAENANRFGNPALLESRMSEVEYHGVVGERVKYDDTTPNAKPDYLVPPPLPQYVLEQQDRAEQAIREISGQHEVTQGRVPSGVTAASAINLLQEQDDTRLGPAVADMESALSLAGQKILTLVARFYTDTRTIKISGEDGAWDIFDFKGAQLRDSTDVQVQAGSAFPRSKAAKQAAMQELLNLFLQYGIPVQKRGMAKFLRQMEVGGLENLVESFDKTEAQINREHHLLAQGEVAEVNAYDDDQAHIDGHEEFQRSITYERLKANPEVVRLTDLHVQAHRAKVIEQMGPPPTQPQLPGMEGATQNGSQDQAGSIQGQGQGQEGIQAQGVPGQPQGIQGPPPR